MIWAPLLILLQSPPAKAAISGVVFNSDTPSPQAIFHAQVELVRGSDTFMALTDVHGQFTISDLAPGQYRITAVHDGFIRKLTTVTVMAGQQLPGVQIGLDEAPTLIGRIRDEYNVPVSNILVELMKPIFGPRGDRTVLSVVSALTDDHGEFHLCWLDPGDYYVRASSLPAKTIAQNSSLNAGYVATYAPYYYPGVRDPKDAAKVRIRLGKPTTFIDFQLQPAPDVSIGGIIYVEATGFKPDHALITARFAGESASSSRYSARSSGPPYPGQYTLPSMPPGTYIVSSQFVVDGQSMTVTRKTTVRATERSFMLQSSPGITVTGRVAPEAGTMSFRSVRISLESIDADLPGPSDVAIDSNGNFSLDRVVPGDYAISLQGLDNEAYLKFASSGGLDILAKPLRIDWKSPAPLEVVLGADGGRLDGIAYDGANRVSANSAVVLVPDAARRNRPDQYRTAVSDDDGKFLLRGIPPGEYKLFAWQTIEPNEYMDANFMAGNEGLGTPLMISANASATANIRVIPTE
jgi:uncharacterized protein (DUF2141 family)